MKGQIFGTLCLALLLQICGYSQILVIPNQIDEKVQTGTTFEKFDFLEYPYYGETVDLRDFKKRTEVLNIPDEINIITPDLTGFRDTTVLVTYLKEEPADPGQLIIWIACNYYSNEVIFYIDRNLDFNFTNDRGPIVQKSKYSAKTIILTPKDTKLRSRTMQLSVPERKLPAKYMARKHHAKIKEQFAWGVQATMGLARINYTYMNTEINFPTWYEVPITEKNLSVDLTYNTTRFIVGAKATYQNLFYWTSYFNVRFDERRVERNPITGARKVFENVDVKRNQDLHTRHRFQWSALAGYRLRLGRRKSIEIQPIFSAGQTIFLNKTYYPDKFDRTIGYQQEPSLFVDGTLRIEFPVGHYRVFGLGYGFSKLWWKPIGYFEDQPVANLDLEYKAHNILLTFRMGI